MGIFGCELCFVVWLCGLAISVSNSFGSLVYVFCVNCVCFFLGVGIMPDNVVLILLCW